LVRFLRLVRAVIKSPWLCTGSAFLTPFIAPMQAWIASASDLPSSSAALAATTQAWRSALLRCLAGFGELAAIQGTEIDPKSSSLGD
jgi:hypothetical protein